MQAFGSLRPLTAWEGGGRRRGHHMGRSCRGAVGASVLSTVPSSRPSLQRSLAPEWRACGRPTAGWPEQHVLRRTFGDHAGHNAQAVRGNRLTNTPVSTCLRWRMGRPPFCHRSRLLAALCAAGGHTRGAFHHMQCSQRKSAFFCFLSTHGLSAHGYCTLRLKPAGGGSGR